MKNTTKAALIGAIICVFVSNFSFLTGQSANKTTQLTQNYIQIRFMCEPCILSSSPIYENLGFKGTGSVGEIRFENGKFASFSHRNSTPSNGWYDYIVTLHYTNAFYSDTVANLDCAWLSYGTLMSPNGNPAPSFDGKEQEIKRGTDTYVEYSIYNDKAFNNSFEIEYVNDSTIIEKHSSTYFRTFTISTQHVKISSPYEDDMWNIEVWLEDGIPIRIKDIRGDRFYQYTSFDDKGNWTEREQISNNGIVNHTQTRIINYN